MATIFEIYIIHPDGCYAEQAAWAAFEELDRLEQELSRHIENSDISRINNLPAHQPLRISLTTFECLQLCAGLYTETNGAFDVTIGFLLDWWLEQDKTRCFPSDEERKTAHRRTGFHLLELNETQHTCELKKSPIQIDLGAIGKGYAIDRMAAVLGDWGIDTALIHGGRSTALAIGKPPQTGGWPLTISHPDAGQVPLAFLHVQNRAISGSGVGKGHHIINPRTGRPIEERRAAWASAQTAGQADALSTAFMVMSPVEIRQHCLSHPDVRHMVLGKTSEREPPIAVKHK